jgi:hypothetical protein
VVAALAHPDGVRNLARRQRYARCRVALPPGPPYKGRVDLDALSQLELTDSTGVPRQLGSFWSERTTVLVFLRHFG